MDCKLNGLLFKELIDIVIQLVKTWGTNKLDETHTYKVYLMEEKYLQYFQVLENTYTQFRLPIPSALNLGTM